MSIKEVTTAIEEGTLMMSDIGIAKSVLENEIDGCNVVIQDPETDWHVREEYKAKRNYYTRLKNRI